MKKIKYRGVQVPIGGEHGGVVKSGNLIPRFTLFL